MAKRTQAMAQILSSSSSTDVADNVWVGAAVTGADRAPGGLGWLPGFGEQKAKIFAALLGKQLQVCSPRAGGRQPASSAKRGSFRSVADIVDEPSLKKVRAYKAAGKGRRQSERAFGVTGLHLGIPAGRVARGRRDGEVGMPDSIPDDVVDAHLPDGQPHARWFLRRFVDSVAGAYRNLDPIVAQVWMAPGIVPVTPDDSID